MICKGGPMSSSLSKKHTASTSHCFISTCYLHGPKIQPVPLSQQAMFWPHQVGPAATNLLTEMLDGKIVPAIGTSWTHIRTESYQFLFYIGSRNFVTLYLRTVYYFQAVFRYLWGYLAPPYNHTI